MRALGMRRGRHLNVVSHVSLDGFDRFNGFDGFDRFGGLGGLDGLRGGRPWGQIVKTSFFFGDIGKRRNLGKRVLYDGKGATNTPWVVRVCECTVARAVVRLGLSVGQPSGLER
jgi:hypothetical protein